MPLGPRSAPEGLFILGGGPSKEDVKQQEPLSGMTGKEMEEVLLSAGIQREKILIAHAYACTPNEPRRDAEEKAAIAACRPLLKHYLKDLPADTPTLLAGKWALLAITGSDEGLMANRGFTDRKWSLNEFSQSGRGAHRADPSTPERGQAGDDQGGGVHLPDPEGDVQGG